MNGARRAAVHDEFLCHVTAYGVSGGQRIGVPLGTYRAPTLSLALWWLRDRATWIAERLDPSPDNDNFPARALAPLADNVPDVPQMLRAWRDNQAHQDRVAEHLAAGQLIRVATRDETTEYELLAESVDALRMDRASPSLIDDSDIQDDYAYAYVKPSEAAGKWHTREDSFADTLQLGRLPR
jgi:hypothetical protein